MNNPQNHQYSQGILDDAAVILRDGQMMTIDEIVSQLNHLQADANRYHYIRDNQIWSRHGSLSDNNAYALMSCKFPYLVNSYSKSMIDFNIDKLLTEQPPQETSSNE